MGETRAKKPSNRALKGKKKADRASSANEEPPSISVASFSSSTETRQTADSDNYLSPTSLSSKTSRTSLLSSNSSATRYGSHQLEDYDPSRVEIRSTHHKGFALFATSLIRQGQIVLAEIPVVRFTTFDESEKLAADDVLREKFKSLSKASLKAFKNLHDSKKDGFSRLRSIYHSNCYNLEGSRSVHGGSCVGLKASRINHSCIPNVQFSFEETAPQTLLERFKINEGIAYEQGESDLHAGIMIFYALRNIPRGTEIVSNYETIYATRKQRQFQLQMHYGFQCDCDACVPCTDHWADDDHRRLEMIKLRQKIDATQRHVVVTKGVLANGADADLYHIKQIRHADSTQDTVEHLAPLSTDCCQDMVQVLRRLETLLKNSKLVGIEQEKIQQELVVWEDRARMSA